MELKTRALATNKSEHGRFVWVYLLLPYAYRTTVMNPRKMMIRQNTDNTSKKRLYSSVNHLVGISNTGRILKSVVLDLFYGSMRCFSTKEECIESFKKIAFKAIEHIEDVKKDTINELNIIIVKYRQLENYDSE